MIGQLCRLGTGYFDLLFDVKKAMTEIRYMPDAVMPHDDDDRNIMEPVGMDSMQTPNIINTPGPYLGGATPHLGSLYIPNDNAFTPNPYSSFQSPAYGTPGRQNINTAPSPGLGLASPVYLDSRSPMYPGPSPSQHSPQYSPNLGSMHYNPISPHYSPSASPSLSSSGAGTRVYSPSSPGYTASPKYSPGYGGGGLSPSNSNTPSSQNPNTLTYTPTQNVGIYVPTSPAYDPNKTIVEEKEEEEEEEEGKQS